MPDCKIRVGIYTLGCKVNQYESEAIAELFSGRGCAILSPTECCDIYIINTCTVTAESDRKARQFIRRALHQNPKAYLLVTGCYSQVSPEEVAAIAGVDYVCGNAAKTAVVDAALKLVKQGKKNETPTVITSSPDACGFEEMTITRFDRTRAYVKIEDGCESHCSYCIIPAARGKIRSKSPEAVLEEVRGLIAGGCREIVLTGIETASYGKDLADCTLADLLERINALPNIGRIRLGSLDPSLMKQDFVDRIAGLHALAPHFHISMQSGSDRVLARMKRKYNTRMALEGMERLRQAIPEVQFTTDMIVGFPGETEEDFAKSLDFARRAGFLMIHVFPYSRRAGTLADQMPDQVPEEIKHRRVKLLSEVAAEVRQKQLDAELGKTSTVLFETYRNGVAYGHTPNFVEVACPVPKPCHAKILPVYLAGHNGTLCNGIVAEIEPKGGEN